MNKQLPLHIINFTQLIGVFYMQYVEITPYLRAQILIKNNLLVSHGVVQSIVISEIEVEYCL